jgi:hypothetical protein
MKMHETLTKFSSNKGSSSYLNIFFRSKFGGEIEGRSPQSITDATLFPLPNIIEARKSNNEMTTQSVKINKKIGGKNPIKKWATPKSHMSREKNLKIIFYGK